MARITNLLSTRFISSMCNLTLNHLDDGLNAIQTKLKFLRESLNLDNGTLSVDNLR